MTFKHDSKLTHHNTAVETLRPHRNNDITTHTFKYLTPAHNEAICMRAQFARLLEAYAFFERKLLDSVRLACSARFVAFDVVTREEDAVAGNDFTWFEKCDVTDDDVLRVGGGERKSARIQPHSPPTQNPPSH